MNDVAEYIPPSGIEYVVGAYGVMGAALVIYLVVVAMRRARLARQAELLSRLEARTNEAAGPDAAPSERNLEPVDK